MKVGWSVLLHSCLKWLFVLKKWHCSLKLSFKAFQIAGPARFPPNGKSKKNPEKIKRHEKFLNAYEIPGTLHGAPAVLMCFATTTWGWHYYSCFRALKEMVWMVQLCHGVQVQNLLSAFKAKRWTQFLKRGHLREWGQLSGLWVGIRSATYLVCGPRKRITEAHFPHL